MFRILGSLLVALWTVSCSKTCPETQCPECKVCPACPECQACPECPECPACPECPQKIEAMATSTVVVMDRSGPKMFLITLAKLVGDKWQRVSTASGSGFVRPDDPADGLSEDFYPYRMVRHLRQYPIADGQVAVEGMDLDICQQKGKSLSCWELTDKDDNEITVFTQISVSLLE